MDDLTATTVEEESPLSELVGEGKKYATIEELAKAYKHSETFIETLKTEKRELESVTDSALARAGKIEDIMKLIRGDKPADPQETQQSDNDEGEEEPMSEEAPVVQPVNEEEILSKVESRIQQKAIKEQSYAKLLDACGGDADHRKALVDKYVAGDESRKLLVEQLAVTDPDGLVRLLQAKPKAPVEDGALDTGRSASEEEQTGKLTWAEAKKVRKENPRLYYSASFQNRLHKEAEQNPDFLKKEK